MMSDVRSLKDDGLIKDNNDIKLVSDFHPRHPIPELCRGLFCAVFSIFAHKIIKEKWKVFEGLWRRRNMYRDYYDAMNQDQTYMFLDKLKELFG